MLWTSKVALLMALASTGTAATKQAMRMSRPGPQVSGLPGFFVEASGRQGGYVAHTPGMQVILKQGGVQMISAAGPLGLRFPGANSRPAVEGCETAPGRINVLHGSAGAWKTGLAAFLCVRYRNLYPGVDLVYRVEGSGVKAEFIVAAGAEPSSIRLRYSGTRRIAVDDAGDLVIATDSGEYRESAPYVYQQSGLARKAVPGRYRVSREEGMAGFDIGAYDRTIPLVIDPTISFSTYFGGSGFDAANAIAVDTTGNIYIAGWTESYDLPMQGASQANKAGGVDAFVAKLDSTGSHILYCTYLGGSGEDRALGIALDSGGNAYITGWTNSTDFPVAGSVVQSRSAGGRDAFVTKIDNSGRLIYSTFLGGNGQDTGTGIAVDTSGNTFISGSTTSANFPVYHPAQSSIGGQQDAFVAGLNSTGTALLFSTYLGGTGDESANALAVDSAGNVYIAGDTKSPNFPTLNALQPAPGGNQDAFVVKLNPATGSLIYSTYLGGTAGTVGLPEIATAIDVDSSGSAYVAGVTSSPNFPVANALRSSLNGFTDAFLVKLTPGGIALVYGTYLGGSSAEVATGVRVDPSGNACVAGYTASQDFPTSSPVQPSNAGAYDAFLSCFTAAGSSLTFSTYFGGDKSDAAYGLALHGPYIYLAGQTLSGDLTLRDPVQNTNAGGFGAMVAKFARESGSGNGFVPVTPCRVMDTRVDQGKTGPFGPPLMAGGTIRNMPVPDGGCGIPATALAYSLNITVLPRGYLGYVIAWPAGQPMPRASVLNSWNGRVVANAAIVPSGTGGAIDLFVSDATDVIVDIDGYFGGADPATAQGFHPVTPCRLMDTRIGQSKTGAFGAPRLGQGMRDLPIPAGGCGIPTTARAYSLNITALPAGYLGYLIVWPAGQTMPRASTLNSWNGMVVANAAIIPAGAGGAVSLLASDPADIIVDINGYFGDEPQPGSAFHAVTPCRLMDTRLEQGGTGRVPGGSSRDLAVPFSGCAIPPTATAYSLNFTVLPAGYLGYVIVWPAGAAMPRASTMNSWDGSVTANAAIIPAGDGGAISVFVSDTTDVIVDIYGYFGP